MGRVYSSDDKQEQMFYPFSVVNTQSGLFSIYKRDSKDGDGWRNVYKASTEPNAKKKLVELAQRNYSRSGVPEEERVITRDFVDTHWIFEGQEEESGWMTVKEPISRDTDDTDDIDESEEPYVDSGKAAWGVLGHQNR